MSDGNLSKAKLTEADLTKANLSRANLREANFVNTYSGSQKSEVCPMPYALCPMPYALCPVLIFLRKAIYATYHSPRY
ncbi:pentapeptide repeat-containing protein [Microcoleus sp. OTE_8_concoct_300]|uniref:pentapeptide repeat-containing protein n=1 Tax=Microcoleus sp. OTE_8_concoct_300 TaxID=2964710 RepID=UPI00403F8254